MGKGRTEVREELLADDDLAVHRGQVHKVASTELSRRTRPSSITPKTETKNKNNTKTRTEPETEVNDGQQLEHTPEYHASPIQTRVSNSYPNRNLSLNSKLNSNLQPKPQSYILPRSLKQFEVLRAL